MNDAARIKELGGATVVARLLAGRTGKPVSVQRVHNWASRGIPPAVKLDHPDLFVGPVQADSSARPQETEARPADDAGAVTTNPTPEPSGGPLPAVLDVQPAGSFLAGV